MKTAGLFSYSSENERIAKTEALKKADTECIYGFERVYEREKLFQDIVNEVVPEDCDKLLLCSLEDLGTGAKEMLANLEFIEEKGLKLDIFYDYEEQLGNVDTLLDIEEKLDKLIG